MYKLYCEACETRFTITDNTFDNFIENEDSYITCPKCNSIEVNIIEVAGQFNKKL